MKRTIHIHNNIVYYKRKELGELTPTIMQTFNIKPKGSYSVTIVHGNKYHIVKDDDCYAYDIYDNCKDGDYRGMVCSESFEVVFGEIDRRKKYNITVKKVG